MKYSRLDFFKTLSVLPLAGIGLPALGLQNRQQSDGHEQNARVKTGATYSRFEPWIEIYPGNMRNNARQLQQAVEGRPVMAVIKNNGYGMGLENSARILEPLDAIEGLAVVKLSEALRLREDGVTKPVLLMAYCEGEELEEALRRDITPMVYTPMGEQLERLARRLDKTVAVEVKVDTGLGRLGVRENEAMPVYRDLAGREGVSIQGSFITCTEDEDFDRQLLSRYDRLMDALEAEGIRPGRRHAASTTPIFRHPEAWYDMVRPGMALYGVYPQPDDQRQMELMDLKPAFGVKCRVLYVKQLKQGETAGYGLAFEAKQDTWLATLSIGHADGWHREAAGCAEVRINGRMYSVVGSVSASHTLVDLGSDTDVQIGDEAVIYDDREGSRPDDIHRACGMSTYDLTMHMSPEIPRHVME